MLRSKAWKLVSGITSTKLAIKGPVNMCKHESLQGMLSFTQHPHMVYHGQGVSLDILDGGQTPHDFTSTNGIDICNL